MFPRVVFEGEIAIGTKLYRVRAVQTDDSTVVVEERDDEDSMGNTRWVKVPEISAIECEALSAAVAELANRRCWAVAVKEADK